MNFTLDEIYDKLERKLQEREDEFDVGAFLPYSKELEERFGKHYVISFYKGGEGEDSVLNSVLPAVWFKEYLIVDDGQMLTWSHEYIKSRLADDSAILTTVTQYPFGMRVEMF